jgi:indolepyruvate ferredoxin oxidoreductase beta subunit
MAFNIYICGVGGQGIGVLAAALASAAEAAGHRARGCDTHGLAQRHGSVSSHLRLGDDALTPRVPEGRADLVLALERLEGLRGALYALKPGGTLVYYDTVYQPVPVRTGLRAYPSAETVAARVAELGGKAVGVSVDGMADPRMQNAALLGRLAALGLVPGFTREALRSALADTLGGRNLEANLAVFDKAAE